MSTKIILEEKTKCVGCEFEMEAGATAYLADGFIGCEECERDAVNNESEDHGADSIEGEE